METIYTSKNQYNYSIKQLIINYETKTYKLLYGGECRISPKNATTKFINNKIQELNLLGFTLTK